MKISILFIFFFCLQGCTSSMVISMAEYDYPYVLMNQGKKDFGDCRKDGSALWLTLLPLTAMLDYATFPVQAIVMAIRNNNLSEAKCNIDSKPGNQI